MKLQFELTMPNQNTSYPTESDYTGYYIWRNVPKDQAERIVGKSFYYNFGDGWGASVIVTQDSRNRKKTKGFRNYDWMVDELVEYGEIKSRYARIVKRKIETEIRDYLYDALLGNKLKESDLDFIIPNISSLVYDAFIINKKTS